MQQMKVKLKDQGYLLIESDVIEVIEGYQQLNPQDKEAGGILIGMYRGDHIHITSLTTPSRFFDKRTRTSFHRRSPCHQAFAIKSWLNSDKTNTWIGEWHTHPEDYPTPSNIDIKSWYQNLPSRQMILLIQGRCSNWLGLWNTDHIATLEAN